MTPAERLARSRLAIVEYLDHREQRHDDRPTSGEDAEGGADVDAADSVDGKGANRRARRPRSRGWLGGVMNAARTWWRDHPAQLALEIVTPALQSYTRRKPFQVLGISAAAGAAIVVTRPWRLISLTTVLIALVKSSQLTGVLMSALTDVHEWQPSAGAGARRRG